MTTIKCKHCGCEIELTEALTKDIEQTILATEHAKHVAEIERIRKEFDDQQSKLTSEIHIKAQTEAAQKFEFKFQSIQKESEEAKNESKELRQQLSNMMQELRNERKAKENAELDARKKLIEEETKIREQAALEADEKYRLKIAEKDKQLTDTQNALDAAQRKSNQGSQQLQGEVLELDLESRLKEECPNDEIVEVKKGQRGADVKQIVRNQFNVSCGSILWETKNGKWQPVWVPKFKQDIRDANANIGVIVSKEVPDGLREIEQIDNNVWVVSPRLSTCLAAALRTTILQVDVANKMNASKDAKMEALYQFLIGPEFKHRVESIIESYTTLQDEIEKEKRAFALKWARQEKAIRSVVDNTIGMYGSLQGITQRALPAIKNLELDGSEVELLEIPSERTLLTQSSEVPDIEI